jgi:hypothetical protein
MRLTARKFCTPEDRISLLRLAGSQNSEMILGQILAKIFSRMSIKIKVFLQAITMKILKIPPKNLISNLNLNLNLNVKTKSPLRYHL